MPRLTSTAAVSAALLGCLSAALTAPADAQQSVTLTAAATSGVGQVTPALSWSTSPPADGCTASGAWSGDREPAGSVTLDPITAAAEYTITCQWGTDPLATLHWSAVDEYESGEPYDDPGSFLIRYAHEADPRHNRGAGLSPDQVAEDCGDVVRCILDIDPSFVTYTVTGLNEPGEWRFVVHACSAANVCSMASPPASKVVTDSATVTRGVTITVHGIPNAPASLSTE